MFCESWYWASKYLRIPMFSAPQYGFLKLLHLGTSMTSLTSITPLMLIFNNFRRPAIDRSVAIPLVATDALRVLKLVTVVGVARPADVIFTTSNLAIFIVSSPIIDNIKMVIVTLCGCHDHAPWRQSHGGLQSPVVAFLDPSALFFALTCSQLWWQWWWCQWWGWCWSSTWPPSEQPQLPPLCCNRAPQPVSMTVQLPFCCWCKNVNLYLWHLEVKEVESQCAKFFYYGSRFVDYIVCRYKGSLHWHQCHPNPHLVDTFAKDRVPSRDLPRCWGCPENLNLPCSPFNLQCHLLFRFGETPFSWAASRSLVTWTKVCQLLSKPALTLYNLLHNASDIMACRDHCQKMAAKNKKEIKK